MAESRVPATIRRYVDDRSSQLFKDAQRRLDHCLTQWRIEQDRRIEEQLRAAIETIRPPAPPPQPPPPAAAGWTHLEINREGTRLRIRLR